jgi:hypothetical protein
MVFRAHCALARFAGGQSCLWTADPELLFPDKTMSLAEFITGNMEAILVEWEAFALTRLPAAASMSHLELRNEAQQILEAIAADLNTP